MLPCRAKPIFHSAASCSWLQHCNPIALSMANVQISTPFHQFKPLQPGHFYMVESPSFPIYLRCKGESSIQTDFSPQKMLLWETYTHEEASLSVTIFSSQSSVAISLLYPLPLPLLLSYIKHTPCIINIWTVTLYKLKLFRFFKNITMKHCH